MTTLIAPTLRSRRVRSLLTGAVVVLAVASGACGGGATHRTGTAAGGSRATTTTAKPDALPASASATGSGGKTTTTVKSSKGAASSAISTTAGSSTAEKPFTPTPITGEADKACIHPGDLQGLTVRGADSARPVIYDTVYSDRSDDFSAHYGTGSGDGVAGPDGTFHTTFTVTPRAPDGDTYITFAATVHGHISRNFATFKIVRAGAPC